MAVNNPHVEYLLHLGDNALVLGHRLSEWCGHGPVLEEDIALANMALDLIGQARLLLSHAGSIEANGRDEDAIAYSRDARQYRNFTMLELPKGDFAFTTLRNFLFSAYQCELWQALSDSSDAQLAAIAAKSIKEARYHLSHNADWTLRLGDGTAESHQRAQTALDTLWLYTVEMFAPWPDIQPLIDRHVAVAPSKLYQPWIKVIEQCMTTATLKIPTATKFLSTGRLGVHSEHLDYLLTEMQVLHRAHPGAVW